MMRCRRMRLVPLLCLVCVVPLVMLVTQMPVAPPPRAVDLHEPPVSGWPRGASRDIALYVRPNLTTVLVPASHVCAVPLLLLVVVCSAVDNEASRLAVRETWASAAYVSQSARVIFFLGTSSSAHVQEESERYGDIVQEDFADSYNNLTVKTVMMLKWFRTFCPEVDYIMKTDDDSVVNVKALTRLLEVEKTDLIGKLIPEVAPIRNPHNKWYMPTYMYADLLYPDYLSGTGYVMSREVAVNLYVAALVTPLLHLEDVYLTGLCARQAGVERRAHAGFSYMTREFAPCGRLTDTIITSHKFSAANMRARWCQLSDGCQIQLTRKQTLIKSLLCLVDKLGFPPPETNIW